MNLFLNKSVPIFFYFVSIQLLVLCASMCVYLHFQRMCNDKYNQCDKNVNKRPKNVIIHGSEIRNSRQFSRNDKIHGDGGNQRGNNKASSCRNNCDINKIGDCRSYGDEDEWDNKFYDVRR